MHSYRIIIATCLFSMLSGCHSHLETLQDIEPEGHGFLAELAHEYRVFAESQQEMLDNEESEHFAVKGTLAAQGNYPAPEDPNSWPVNTKELSALKKSRAQLVEKLEDTTRSMAPAQAAQAQTLYDCWVIQSARYSIDSDFAVCRDAFQLALEGLDAPEAADTLTPDESPSPLYFPEDNSSIHSAWPQPPLPGDATHYTLYFAYDRATLTAGAKQAIRHIHRSIDPATHEVLITLTGHTDRRGPIAFNDLLGRMRAQAVQVELLKLGVNGARIIVHSQGESQPAVRTPDGVAEPKNRRVEIDIISGQVQAEHSSAGGHNHG